ncbi:MAG: hypothetical protein ABI760_11650 [Ferruginibacter sp.]
MSDFLTIPAQEYIHLPSIGDYAKCKSSFDMINYSLKQYHKDAKIKGFHLIIIKNQDDIEAHYIETSFKDVTNDVYPFLYLFIQPVLKYEELEIITKELNLRIIT